MWARRKSTDDSLTIFKINERFVSGIYIEFPDLKTSLLNKKKDGVLIRHLSLFSEFVYKKCGMVLVHFNKNY